MKKHILIFILLLFLSEQLFSANNTSKAVRDNSRACRIAFIKSFFSISSHIITYRSQEGYLRFVEEHFPNLQMDTVFVYVSKILPKKELTELGWQKYVGTVSGFRAERNRLFNEQGKLKEEFIGLEGYARYVEEYHNSQMERAFVNVSAVLLKAEMKKLGWQLYKGTVIDFRKERGRLFNEQGKLREEFIDMAGYARYAEKHHGSQMARAFANVSTVLSKVEMKELGWQRYEGSVNSFRKERGRLFSEQGELREEFIGLEGYARYAEKHHDSQMARAFQNVSVVISKAEMKKLGWQTYQGTVSSFRAERSRLFNEQGKLREEFIGPAGYARYAEKHHDSQMARAFQNVSVVLSKAELKELGWQTYQGTVSSFRAERSQLFNEQGKLIKEFIDMAGYARYAEKHHDSQMQRAFTNVSAVLSKVEMRELGWKQYQGTVSSFREERGRLFNEKSNLRKEFIGPAGYARYAKEYHDSQMLRAFSNVSAVLSKVEMRELGWQTYQGIVSNFREERGRLFNEQGKLRQEFIDMAGYARYVKKHHNSQMQRAFANVSAVISKAEMKKLGWQVYRGTVSDFREERSRILNEHGEAREEFIGLEGYVRYAEKHHNSQMERAFVNVSAVLSKAEMKKLSWKLFQGTTEQFYQLRDYFKAHKFEDYQGHEGQRKIAELIFKGSLRAAYMNVSTLREYLFSNKNEFKDLRQSGWFRIRE